MRSLLLLLVDDETARDRWVNFDSGVAIDAPNRDHRCMCRPSPLTLLPAGERGKLR